MLEWKLIRVSKPWMTAVVVWVGAIFFTSTSLAQQLAEQFYNFFTGQISTPRPEHGMPFLVADKGFHVAIFFVFAVLLSRALIRAPRKALLVIAAGAVVGSCSEYLQSFFPGRDPAIHDVLINTAGTALGVLAYFCFTLKQSAVPAASTNL